MAIISRNRTASSPFAGGSVIQHHGIRLSDDQDIFTAGDPEPVMQNDVKALNAAGLTVKETKSYPGFRECLVTKPGIANTTLQWTQALGLEYFKPVPDEDFGHRLHFVDLAANKTLATANRMVVRDFIDLWMLDKHVMPLWRMACAASSKSEEISPLAIVERIARNRQPAFTRQVQQSELLTTIEVSTSEVTENLMDAMDLARDILFRLPGHCLGKLQIASSGHPVLSREPVAGGEDSWIRPQPGGTLPTLAGADEAMVNALIAEYG